MRWMFLVLLAGCPKRGPVEPPLTLFGCRITVQQVSAPAVPVVGEASGPEEAAVKEAAWAAACAQLPEGVRDACGVEAPPEGYTWSQGGGSASGGGPVTWSLRVEITALDNPTQAVAGGESYESMDAACRTATDAACAELSAPAGCEASDGYTIGGRATTERTVRPETAPPPSE